jgi:hypothetical protein
MVHLSDADMALLRSHGVPANVADAVGHLVDVMIARQRLLAANVAFAHTRDAARMKGTDFDAPLFCDLMIAQYDDTLSKITL